MQIIEVTGYAIRSAVITLRRRESPLRFLLVPMIHVASPAFYAQVRSRLAACDLIVAEGVHGRSREASTLTLAYRLAPRRGRNGLVEQSKAAVLPSGVPVVNPDVTAAEAVEEIRAGTGLKYPLLLAAAPILGLIFALRGPRVFLDEDVAVEDLPSTHRAEHMTAADEQTFGGKRDERLLAALKSIHEKRRAERITVAVLYGAAHMPAVVSGLGAAYGYRPREAEWLTVCVPE